MSWEEMLSRKLVAVRKFKILRGFLHSWLENVLPVMNTLKLRKILNTMLKQIITVLNVFFCETEHCSKDKLESHFLNSHM